MSHKSDDPKVAKILSDEKLCLTKILSKKPCIFRLFYWKKGMKFIKVTKILSDIVLSDKVFLEILPCKMAIYFAIVQSLSFTTAVEIHLFPEFFSIS